jgi:hypothetical protein
MTRTVILIGRWAVKVPTGRGVGQDSRRVRGRLAGIARGLLANQSEHTWHDFRRWDGGVAPVLRSWLGGFVQVYPRCVPLTEDEPGWTYDDGWHYSGAEPLPVLDPSPRDMKPDNYGRLNGRLVRLDYEMD